MTVQTYEVNAGELANSISVTNAAAEHFQRQLQKTGKSAVRISLKESGCTGFMYIIEEIDDAVPGDVQKALANGVELYIDPQNLAALGGTEIDYAQQGLNRNLVMNNPNVKDACGCGESFTI